MSKQSETDGRSFTFSLDIFYVKGWLNPMLRGEGKGVEQINTRCIIHKEADEYGIKRTKFNYKVEAMLKIICLYNRKRGQN